LGLPFAAWDIKALAESSGTQGSNAGIRLLLSMALLAPEWDNPIFYLNAAGFAASVFALVKLRRLAREDKADAAWVPVLAILAVGTGLHFIGDLTGFPEDLDHIFIHGVVLAALLPVVAMLLRD